MCDDGWNTADATVVCRQLGFYSSVRAYGSAYFGQGTGPIWLSRLSCIGNESSLPDCAQFNVGTKNCTHSDDAGVNCGYYYRDRTRRKPQNHFKSMYAKYILLNYRSTNQINKWQK